MFCIRTFNLKIYPGCAIEMNLLKEVWEEDLRSWDIEEEGI